MVEARRDVAGLLAALELLLRLLPDNDPADRAAAFAEVCRLLQIDPVTIPVAGSGDDRAWAEQTWGR